MKKSFFSLMGTVLIVLLSLTCSCTRGLSPEECRIITADAPQGRSEYGGRLLRVWKITDQEDSLLLRATATPVSRSMIASPVFDELCERMMVTVRDSLDEGVGIAAPQVGISRRLIIVQRFDKPGEPYEWYINPEILSMSDSMRIGGEGCLSIPGVFGKVSRASEITLRYRTRTWEEVTETISGFSAVIFQHEIDHLNGVLFIDRMRSFSILGDSYSTFYGWMPEGYRTWYAAKDDGSNAQPGNDVTSVTQTWWYRLYKETGINPQVNSSFSGTTICNTGYKGRDASANSFIARMKQDLGPRQKGLVPLAQYIFIFGGTNDSWAGVPVGSLQYGDWTAEDLKQCLPATCYMMDYLTKSHPGATIINLVNPLIKDEIKAGFREASAHYGVRNLELEPFEVQANHPSQEGMASITAQIIRFLNTID